MMTVPPDCCNAWHVTFGDMRWLLFRLKTTSSFGMPTHSAGRSLSNSFDHCLAAGTASVGARLSWLCCYMGVSC